MADATSNYSPSRLELTLRKVKEGTEISMVHSNVPAEQAEALKQDGMTSTGSH